MLGLPILTGMAGVFPSLVMFIIACFFMTATGLLIVEVNQWFDSRTNFITMVSTMLGPVGRLLCWILYLFLFYALLIAYIAGSGQHVASFFPQGSLPVWAGALFFVVLFGWMVYLGTRSVDITNRFLMFGKILVYVVLLVVGFQYVQGKLLEHVDIKYAFFPLPILVISFGFQNMIPVLSDYLGGDTKRVKISIVGGSLFALLIYVFWQIIALGNIPIEGDNGILSSYIKGIDGAQALKEVVKSPLVATFAALLAFFAILTSFLAQSLSLVHFLSDGLNVGKKKRENIGICLLALVPPLLFAVMKPDIFYLALNFAGGICAVILFGILPVLMVWRGRYTKQLDSNYTVFGGRVLLFALLALAVFILFYQVTQTIGLHIFPTPKFNPT